MYYYNARFYDPKVARFLTMDPMREYMGPYAYVQWNPIGSTDPSGMLTVPDAGGAAGINYVDRDSRQQISGGYSASLKENIALGLVDELSPIDQARLLNTADLALEMELANVLSRNATTLQAINFLYSFKESFPAAYAGFNTQAMQEDGLREPMIDPCTLVVGGAGGVASRGVAVAAKAVGAAAAKSGAKASTQGAIGFARGLGQSALGNDAQVQHAASHLIKAGILPSWNSASGKQAAHALYTGILENPMATFSHSLGGVPVRGFIGEASGTAVAAFVYAGGPMQGQLASSWVPSLAQLISYGVR
jgi:hypothetical protein